ncbi:hypothetical protein [Ornithinimicrobium cryptoxanthini]|uniref:hypothetical protein n=1 Tax=Ornithinimicrobium cryptoxanthini TaxID=2934161 RepID=UPI00211777E7|nr:hypothetical protein [Ornithinimicrobium cryptoxanthini]
MNTKPATKTAGRMTVHGATILSRLPLRASLVAMLAAGCVSGGYEVAPDGPPFRLSGSAAAVTEDAEDDTGRYLQPMRPMTWEQSEDHRRQLRHAEALRDREATDEANQPQAMTWAESEDHRRLLQHAQVLRQRERATTEAGDQPQAMTWEQSEDHRRLVQHAQRQEHQANESSVR